VIGIPSNTAKISISAVPLVFEERTITGSLYGSASPRLDIPKMINLYKDGKLNLEKLLTNQYPLEEINEAYDAMMSGESLRSVITF
jgi:S-(hydroxymethyl)glutathione dehydrogenase/alcohol dehydrogenase